MIRSLLVALLVVSLAGCGFIDKTEKAEYQSNAISPSGAIDSQVNAPDTPVSSDESSQTTPQTYPREVQDLIETMKTIEGGAWVAVGDETFIVVSRGMKPTAGYTVEIKEIVAEGDGAVASVSFKDPPEGSAVAEVITHPYAVGKIRGRFADVQFRDVDGRMEYIPRVVGLKDNYLARGEGNIRLLSCHVNSSNIRVSGIARVFEANLNYELQDAAGNVLDRGYTMAASGAPDWGFFQVEIHNLPPSAARLQLYHASPKDGSHQDIVTIEIE